MKKRFTDLAIKYKILAGYFGVLAMFCILGGYYIYATRGISRASRQVELRNFAGVELVTSLQMNMVDISHLAHGIVSLRKEEKIQGYRRQMELYVHKFRILLSEFKDIVKGEPVTLEKVSGIETNFEKYCHLINKRITARLQGKGSLQYIEEGILLEQLSRDLKDLRDEDIANLSWALGRIDRLSSDARHHYLWLLLLTIGVAVIFACRIAKFIAGPIKDLVVASRKLGNGNLDYPIKIKSKDEIGSLQTAFMYMRERLKRTYQDLQKERNELEARVKQRTKDLEESQLHLRKIADGIEEGIMLLDTDYRVLWANKKITQWHDFKLADSIKHCYEITHNVEAPCESSEHRCPLKDVLKTKRPSTEIHTHYDAVGNKSYFVEVTVYPLMDKEGNIKEFIHVARDITEKVKQDEKMQGYIRNLEQVQQELKKKITELERFSKLTVGRELKMIELKKKLKELEEKLK
jgi:PAS domain S-box-containing protein